MPRFIWVLVFVIMAAMGSLAKPTDAHAQFLGAGCPSFTDVFIFPVSGVQCIAVQPPAIANTVTIATVGNALDPIRVGPSEVMVAIFSNGGNGITVNLGTDASNIRLTGATTTPTLFAPPFPSNRFLISAAIADAINARVTFDANGETLFFDIAKSAGNPSLSAFTIQAVPKPMPVITTSSNSFNQSAPGTFTATVTFSEAVTGFTSGDLTATNATLGALSPAGGSGTVFTTTVTPAGTGDVALNVAQNIAQSLSFQNNTAAPQITVTQTDDIAPTVQIPNPPANHNGLSAVNVTFEFSEDVMNFVQSDIVATNATLSNFVSVDGNTYTVDVTPTGNNDIMISAAGGVAQDAAGNNNTAIVQTIVFLQDIIDPTVQILSAPAAHNGSATFNVTFEFSENVVGFTQGDITITNAALSNFIAVDGNTFTADVTPSALGDITINVAAGVTQDPIGNMNAASSMTTVTLGEMVQPTVQILNAPANHNGTTPFNVTVEFSESIMGFAQGDITIANGTLSNFVSVDGNTFTVDVTPVGLNDITLDVAADVAQDLIGNFNIAAVQVTVTDQTIGVTRQVIGEFLVNRANLLLGSQPDLSGFIKGTNLGGSGRFGNLSVNANADSHLLSFATSRSKILSGVGQGNRAYGAIDQATGLSPRFATARQSGANRNSSGKPVIKPAFALFKIRKSKDEVAPEIENLPGVYLQNDQAGDEIITGSIEDDAEARGRTGTWDIWTEIYSSRSNSGASNSKFGIGYVGAHYFLNEHTLVGVMGQLDWSEETGSSSNSSAEGIGGMVGPYIAGQLPGQSLFYEARAAWGISDNEVSPTGTYTDSFDTTRWLASGKISGSFTRDEYVISPHVSVSYFEETQNSYADNFANTIPEQTVSLGEVQFGPSVATIYELEDGTVLQPSVGVSGVVNFGIEENAATQGSPLGDDDFRAKFDLGLNATNDSGMHMSLSGFYDGVGVDDYNSFGGSARFTVPLN